MKKVLIAWIFKWYFFVLIVLLVAGKIYGESSQEISEPSNFFFEKSSGMDYSNDISYENADFTILNFSPTENSEYSYSIESPSGTNEPLRSPYYNPFLFEHEQGKKIVCQEQFCTRGLYGKKSSKLFKSYIKSVLNHYILESKVRSWFFRLWSESTVLTSPVLYIEKKPEFKEIYKLARRNYQKLKDSAVIVILKVLTKKVSKELTLEEKEEEEASKSNSAENREYSSTEYEGTRTEEQDTSRGISSSISQTVKSLCVKLRSLSKHRMSDNGQSYLFVVEAYEITDRLIFSRLMTSLIQTSCWNRANINKSRVIIPVIVGHFKYSKENNGILSDVYDSNFKSKSKRSGSKSKIDKSPNSMSKSRSRSTRDEEQTELEKDLGQMDFSVDLDQGYNSLFVKWLKKCNESKIIYERYNMISPGLFEKLLTQYLIYAINNKVITHEISKSAQGVSHFLSEYPTNCHNSWNKLLKLIETEYETSDMGFKTLLISTILESLQVANFTLFKEVDSQQNKESDQKELSSKEEELNGEEKGKNGSEDFASTQSRSTIQKELEVSELYSILSSKEQNPTTLSQARIMDDLLIRLEELPDQRKSRLEFKKYISNLKMDRETATQVLELFEAVDYIQNSMHLLRVMYITSMELGLTTNPLEILISVCRNAKLIPIDEQGGVRDKSKKGKSMRRRKNKKSKKGRRSEKDDMMEASYMNQNTGEGDEETHRSVSESEDLEEENQKNEEELQIEDSKGDNEDMMEECNPFNYLSEELLSEEYEGDIMESIQKSSVKLASLILSLTNYNTKILSIHVSNLVIKTERLILSNVLESQKIPSMVLILSEKIHTFPFNFLSSFSYLKEVFETRTAALLKPFIPLYPSYTLMGLYGDSIEIKNWKQLGKVLMMEICILYYDPKSLLESEFVSLCNSTWESDNKDDEYHKNISKANTKCRKLSKEVKNQEMNGKIGNNSPTVFLFCDLLDKLVNGPSSRNDRGFTGIKKMYVSKEFENKCENIKSYSIQQSGNLYNMLVKL
ncbi:uncharacterized protein cubi_01615 [Cryptosporidium ubiquitum]|uniref:Uncharacterized protein n=1 Tax=Cryptosporidium ubiquitum TaxID=857276 RepID=A0A1J4MDF8_9CRYT|nr:uncharacterized protein cubi_01615 [Cryptosporidium ubiquitum]OII72282.1 hypothetical protein cubi_01615 [Cryptosporidium ubiquitum]